MAIVRVQGAVNSNTADAASIAVTLSGSATNNNTLIGTCGRRNVSGNIGDITEPSGFTEAVISAAGTTTGNRTQISYKLVSGDGTGPFTFTNTVQNQEIAAAVVEFSGLKTSSVLGDTANSYNTSGVSTGGTTSINVDTTGTLSLLVFAMTHSDVSSTPITSLAFSNSFTGDIAIIVMVDANDVDHYTATKQVTSAANHACVATWATTAHISSQALAEFFGEVGDATVPVLTVPGSQTGTMGTPKVISGFTASDTGSNIDTVTATCAAGMTITFDLTGTSVTHGSTNGTNSVTLSGTQADLITVLEADITVSYAESWPTYEDTVVMTVTVIDAADNQDQETVSIDWTSAAATFLTGSAATILANLQALDYTSSVVGLHNILLVSETSNSLSDSDTLQIEVTGVVVPPVLTVPSTQYAAYGTPKAITGVSVTHAGDATVSLLFECPAAMTMNFDAGATGASLTGDESNSVLIEDTTEADLTTVAGSLIVSRSTPVTPVPSDLVPDSANTYSIKANLQVNDGIFTDRLSPLYTFDSIPALFLGATWISTPNDDKAATAADTLVFTLNAPAWVYLTRDSRSSEAVTLPTWLSTWESVAESLVFRDTTSPTVNQDMFRKSFPAGSVTLGGYDFGVLYMNYVVVILPIDATVPVQVTATDSSGNTDIETFNVAWSVTGVGGGGVGISNLIQRRRRKH